jgi:acetylglutamate/LysW-gamma-L-alpha-aminoadipate kinase
VTEMLIVVKVGGDILKWRRSHELILDIKNLLSEHKIVLVHGGGVEVTEIASKLGKRQKFVVSPKGFRSRYTDKDTIEIYTMVMAGKINKKIVCTLQTHGVSGVGLSGLDGSLIKALRKKRIVTIDETGRKRVVDGGYTGKINKINTQLLQLLIENDYVPVIAPIAISEKFEPLNVDGDRTAAYIAGALKADRLVLLTGVQGLIFNDKLVPKLTVPEVKKVLPKIGGGMITKVYAAIEALEQDVGEVLISFGLETHPISSPLKHKCGTVISHE